MGKLYVCVIYFVYYFLYYLYVFVLYDLFVIYLSFLKIYLFVRDTEREAETQAEGEAGSMQGARCGTRSQYPEIMTSAKGRCSTAEPPRHPNIPLLLKSKATLAYGDGDIALTSHKGKGQPLKPGSLTSGPVRCSRDSSEHRNHPWSLLKCLYPTHRHSASLSLE